MYTVVFGISKESKHEFHCVEEIAVGEQIDKLEKIKNDEIFKHTLPTRAIYQLTGKNLNVTFDAKQYQCIFVKVEQG